MKNYFLIIKFKTIKFSNLNELLQLKKAYKFRNLY